MAIIWLGGHTGKKKHTAEERLQKQLFFPIQILTLRSLHNNNAMVTCVLRGYIHVSLNSLVLPTVNFDKFHDTALLSLTFEVALVLLYLQPI